MKGVKKSVCRLLKTMIDKEVNADGHLSSKCISIFYQPSRKNAKSRKDMKL